MASIGSRIIQEILQKKSKVPKSMKKLAPVFFISFERVKYHKIATNTSRNTQIFLEPFYETIKRHRGPSSENRSENSKKHKKLKRKPKAQALSPIPTRIRGSGSPERTRGVGLIRI